MKAEAKFNQETRDFYMMVIDGKPIETQIDYMEIAERQKYHYYCDCGDRFTTEQDRLYHSQWNEIIEMLNELKNINRAPH